MKTDDQQNSKEFKNDLKLSMNYTDVMVVIDNFRKALDIFYVAPVSESLHRIHYTYDSIQGSQSDLTPVLVLRHFDGTRLKLRFTNDLAKIEVSMGAVVASLHRIGQALWSADLEWLSETGKVYRESLTMKRQCRVKLFSTESSVMARKCAIRLCFDEAYPWQLQYIDHYFESPRTHVENLGERVESGTDGVILN
ncbi:MAG: hypothetical protein LUC43_08110 [Burkholderiales bacterium]|nr:hypothetical protein [Burkholderiales bacterium]